MIAAVREGGERGSGQRLRSLAMQIAAPPLLMTTRTVKMNLKVKVGVAEDSRAAMMKCNKSVGCVRPVPLRHGRAAPSQRTPHLAS